MKTSKLRIFALTVSALIGTGLISACNKPPAIDEVPAKSLAYYSAHVPEANEVMKNCRVFEQNEYSTMSPSKQQAWRETATGVNCENAEYASTLAANQAYQKGLQDSAAKYLTSPAAAAPSSKK